MPDPLGPWDHDDLFNEPEDEDHAPDFAIEPSGTAPTPGALLLGALERRERLVRHGALRPEDLDVWEVAGAMGVQGDVEFVSEDARGAHFHFPTEVLHVSRAAWPPWRLLTVWEWAAEAEANAFWAEGWED